MSLVKKEGHKVSLSDNINSVKYLTTLKVKLKLFKDCGMIIFALRQEEEERDRTVPNSSIGTHCVPFRQQWAILGIKLKNEP